MNFKREPFKTCFGRVSVAMHVLMKVFAWISKTVQCQTHSVRKMVGLHATLAYSWHSQGLTRILMLLILGMKCKTYGSTPSLAYSPIFVIPLSGHMKSFFKFTYYFHLKCIGDCTGVPHLIVLCVSLIVLCLSSHSKSPTTWIFLFNLKLWIGDFPLNKTCNYAETCRNIELSKMQTHNDKSIKNEGRNWQVSI